MVWYLIWDGRSRVRVVMGGVLSLCWTNVLSMLGRMIGLCYLQLFGLNLWGGVANCSDIARTRVCP